MVSLFEAGLEVRDSHPGFHDDRQIIGLPIENPVQPFGREDNVGFNSVSKTLIAAAAPQQNTEPVLGGETENRRANGKDVV